MIEGLILPDVGHAEAAAMGLISRVVPHADLEAALALAFVPNKLTDVITGCAVAAAV